MELAKKKSPTHINSEGRAFYYRLSLIKEHNPQGFSIKNNPISWT